MICLEFFIQEIFSLKRPSSFQLLEYEFKMCRFFCSIPAKLPTRCCNQSEDIKTRHVSLKQM